MPKSKMLLMVALALVGTAVLADPVQWPVAEGGNGHYYEAVDGAMPWNEASTGAASLEWEGYLGRLATITSAAEHQFIIESIGGHAGYWLGAVQQPGSIEPDGGWTWISGEPWGYTNWASGEPNDAGDEKYLITVWWAQTNEWNDVANDGTYVGKGSLADYVNGLLVEYHPASAVSGSTWGRVKATYR